MKNNNIPLKRGQIWLNSTGLPAYKVIRPLNDGWIVTAIWSGVDKFVKGNGLSENYILADESIIDQLLEKYS